MKHFKEERSKTLNFDAMQKQDINRLSGHKNEAIIFSRFMDIDVRDSKWKIS